MVEQPIRNRQVAGSSPALGSNIFSNLQLASLLAFVILRYCCAKLSLAVSIWGAVVRCRIFRSHCLDFSEWPFLWESVLPRNTPIDALDCWPTGVSSANTEVGSGVASLNFSSEGLPVIRE